MITVVGVRYKRAGRIYYFDPCDLELHVGDNVVVDTARGSVLASITQIPKEVADEEVVQPLKKVLRLATFEDIKAYEGLKEKEDKALLECASLIKRFNLPMSLVTAEYNLDLSRLTIYFGAEGRVDFRELVKELNRNLHTMVELRQIGPRDEAKIIGGYGRCGRQLCCEGFLTDFHPVSIKMAKEQNLPLNSTKISGVCGRLLCCLGYEYSQYKEQNRRMPKRNTNVESPAGLATVVSFKPMEELVTVRTENEALLEFPLSSLKINGVFLAETVTYTDEETIASDEDMDLDDVVALEEISAAGSVVLKASNIKSQNNQNKSIPSSQSYKANSMPKIKVSADVPSAQVPTPRSQESIEERKNRNYRRHGQNKRLEQQTDHQQNSGVVPVQNDKQSQEIGNQPRRKFRPRNSFKPPQNNGS